MTQGNDPLLCMHCPIHVWYVRLFDSCTEAEGRSEVTCPQVTRTNLVHSGHTHTRTHTLLISCQQSPCLLEQCMI